VGSPVFTLSIVFEYEGVPTRFRALVMNGSPRGCLESPLSNLENAPLQCVYKNRICLSSSWPIEEYERVLNKEVQRSGLKDSDKQATKGIPSFPYRTASRGSKENNYLQKRPWPSERLVANL
jgi:hypothetical protein